jgi:phosphatidylglycerophosphate synthase
MFDRAVRRRIDPVLDQLAHYGGQHGIKADHVTWIGFVVGLACMSAIAANWHTGGLVFLLLNRFCDGLDGALARATMPTDYGAYLDIVLDFLFYAGFIFAFAVAHPDHAFAAAFLIFSFVGTGTSFLAHAIFAAKKGWNLDPVRRKGFAHLGGLTEGSETIAVFAAMLLWPAGFPTLAWSFGILCWLTTIFRVSSTLRTLRE